MIQQLLLIAHVLIAIGIVAFVLIQRGKGAEAGAAFGGGASGTMFGARGSASFLTRTTSVLATGFFATSLALAFFANQPRDAGSDSVVGEDGGSVIEAPAGGRTENDLPPAADEAGGEGAGDIPAPPPAATDDGEGDGGAQAPP